jgi:hypothetical protein
MLKLYDSPNPLFEFLSSWQHNPHTEQVGIVVTL